MQVVERLVYKYRCFRIGEHPCERAWSLGRLQGVYHREFGVRLQAWFARLNTDPLAMSACGLVASVARKRVCGPQRSRKPR